MMKNSTNLIALFTSLTIACGDESPSPQPPPPDELCAGVPAPVPTDAPMYLMCVDGAATIDASHNFTNISYYFSAFTTQQNALEVFELSGRQVADDRALAVSLTGEFTHPEVSAESTDFVGTEDGATAPVRLTVCASRDTDGARNARLVTGTLSLEMRCVTQADIDNARGFCADFGFSNVTPEVAIRPEDWSFLVSFLGEPDVETVDAAMAEIDADPAVTLLEELSSDGLWIYRVDIAAATTADTVRTTIVDAWCSLDERLQVFPNTPLVEI